MKKLLNVVVAAFYTLLVGVVPALPQAALLPNAKQTFVDQNGKPLTGGKVFSYVPSTVVPKTTWSDANQTTPNTNPVTLDSAGRAVIYGQGSYQQKLTDSAGNLVWNAPTTAWNSASPSGANGTDTAPVGTMMPYSGLTAPTNWQFAYGQGINRADFPDLLTAITISDTTVQCTSASKIMSGWADTSQMRVGAPVEASCLSVGTVIVSIDSASQITVNNNATATATVTATVYPWGNGDGALTFNVPDMRGRVPAGPDAMGGTAASRLGVTTTVATTSGSPIIIVTSASGIYKGMVVAATNVPAATTVSSVVGTHVTLSANATGTGSGITATFNAAATLAMGDAVGAGSYVTVQSELSNGLGTATSTVTDPGHTHQIQATSAGSALIADPTGAYLGGFSVYRLGLAALGVLMATDSVATHTTGITVGSTITNNLEVVTNLTTTNTSPTATVASATGLWTGMTIIAAGVPNGTTVSALVGTTVTMSANATASATVSSKFQFASGGASHPALPPTLLINYIIKVKPNTTGAGGVVSVNGMFGDIICDATFQCAQIATVNTIGLALAGNSTMLANVSGGSAQPTPTTLTQWLDSSCGAAQGDIIYRSAATWSCLPPGIAGQLLQTRGAAQNPLWVSATVAAGVASVGGMIDVIVCDATFRCSTQAGVNTIGLSTVANGHLLANVSGSTAQPTDTAWTTLLDSVCGSTTGMIAKRGSSTWNCLAPGTAGQALIMSSGLQTIWGNTGYQSDIRVVTTAGVTIGANDQIVVINKAAPSATAVTLPAISARTNPNQAVQITDWAGNAGNITITPNGAETIMGLASWVVTSGGVAGSGGSVTLVPSSALSGWIVQ